MTDQPTPTPTRPPTQEVVKLREELEQARDIIGERDAALADIASGLGAIQAGDLAAGKPTNPTYQLAVIGGKLHRRFIDLTTGVLTWEPIPEFETIEEADLA